MKVIEKSSMKDGVRIQLEDWDGSLIIGAYPIAKNWDWLINPGETFRLTISENKYENYTNDDVKADFEALKDGKKRLEDMAHLFHYAKRDAILLGIEPA